MATTPRRASSWCAPKLWRKWGSRSRALHRSSRPHHKGDIMVDWFVQTLRTYPEIAIFLSLALGYYFGSFTYKGLGLGAVTATLIAAVIIGQLEIKITGPLKPFFFLMFLFAIGYAVGPQFVRGIAKDGIPQAIFAAVQCAFCLIVPFL